MGVYTFRFGNREKILIGVLAAVLLSAGVLYFHGASSCPHVPTSLSAEWSLVDNGNGLLVYSIPSDPRCLEKGIVKAYGQRAYQIVSIEDNIPRLDLPYFPSKVASLRSIIVNDPVCGPESYIIAFDGNRSLLYVGTVPINKRIHEFNAENSLCAWAQSRFRNIVSSSEVSADMGGIVVRQCYLQVKDDFNRFLAEINGEANFVGILGAARVYRFPNHITANVVPPEGNSPIGVIVYRPEVISPEENVEK